MCRPANDGLAGAQLATEDDNATGRFLNQRYTLIEKLLGENDDPVAAMNALADQGASFIVTSLDADRLLEGGGCRQGARRDLDQRVRIGRAAARAGLSRQCHSCRAHALHACRRAGAISGLEKVAQMDADDGFARKRRAVCRRTAPCRDAFRRQDRRGAGIQGQRRRAPDRQRCRRNPAADAGGDAERARPRCAGRGGRKRGLCGLSAVPDLGSASGRRLRRTGAHHVGRGVRSMGRGAVAEPLHKERSSAR